MTINKKIVPGMFVLVLLFMSAVSVCAQSVNPDGGLVVYYPFDGDVRDYSGNGNDGSNYGATFVSGISGQALSFDGMNDYVSAMVDINPDVMPQMTMTVWVRADDDSGTIISHDNGGYDRTIDIDNRGGGFGWSAFSGSGGVLGYYPVTIGEWVFLAAVYDQDAGLVKLYVNDIYMYQENGELGSGWDKFHIGSNPTYGAYFSGTIDEVRIYDYALSADEIASLYESAGSLPPATSTITESTPTPVQSYGGEVHSIQSYNYPDYYIRHLNSLGEITKIVSALDKEDASFSVVPGLADSRYVSFESVNYPGYYLRHQDSRIKLQKMTDDDLFKKDSTFQIVPGLADSSWVSFESYNYPGYFIRHAFGHLYIEKGDTDLFRKDATFKLVSPKYQPAEETITTSTPTTTPTIIKSPPTTVTPTTTATTTPTGISYLIFESRSKSSGSTVQIPLTLKGVEEDIGNMDITLSYDPSVLAATQVIKGGLTANSVFDYNIVNKGTIKISLSMKGEQGFNGDGSIAYIIFDVIGSEGSDSRLDIVSFSANRAEDMKQMDILTQDGVFFVGGVDECRGDCDGDGEITPVDALCALRMAVGKIPEDLVMDVNGDGTVSSLDAREILKKSVKKEEESGYGDLKVTYISREEFQEKYTVSYNETFKYDDDGDGANEATLYYNGENNLVMSSDDTDKDGKVDLIFHYDDEEYLTRAIRDTDGDGELDQILHFNRDEEIIKVEKIMSDDTRS